MSNCLQCFSTVLIPCNSILNIWEFHIFQLLIEAKVRKDEKEIKWYSSACLEQVGQRSHGCPTPTGDICSCDALTFCLPAHFWNNTTVSEKFSVFCQKITEIRKQTLFNLQNRSSQSYLKAYRTFHTTFSERGHWWHLGGMDAQVYCSSSPSSTFTMDKNIPFSQGPLWSTQP